MGAPGMSSNQTDTVRLNGWIRIGADGRIGLAMPRSDARQNLIDSLTCATARQS